jgi:hypothetical protein
MNLNNVEGPVDILLQASSELSTELAKNDIPLIIGGGLSLYIRTTFLKKKRSPRYPYQAFQRSTKDIDIYLTSNLIADSKKLNLMRDTLTQLGYTVKTQYFQYTKEFNNGKSVVIDVLAAPLNKNDKDIRVKLKDVKNFHARKNDEAEGIDIGLIHIPGLSENLYLISSFNFIILKLHAFRDRLNDESVDKGRYHAFDVFATVLDMGESDWKNAKSHYESFSTADNIQSAGRIVLEYFADEYDIGIIRLKENELFRKNTVVYDSYITSFINDLKELFNLTAI